jgi:hypothetical protein
LPIEKLERLILEAKMQAIGEVGLSTSVAESGDKAQ